MKLVVAIVQDYDVDRLLTSLSERQIGATRLASMGGFLRSGNTTVLMGMEDNKVRDALDVLHHTCRSRTVTVPHSVIDSIAETYPAGVADVTIGGAVVFVTPVTRYERFYGS